MSNTRYTPQDDDVILEQVSKYPGNLSVAFEQAGIQLGRKSVSVSSHYYDALRKDSSRRATTALVTTKGVLANTKNIPRNGVEETLRAFDVAKIATDMLTPAEKKALIHYMLTK